MTKEQYEQILQQETARDKALEAVKERQALTRPGDIQREVTEKMKMHQPVPRPESERSSQKSDYKGPGTPEDYNKYLKEAEKKVDGKNALERENTRQPYDDKIAQIKASAPAHPEKTDAGIPSKDKEQRSQIEQIEISRDKALGDLKAKQELSKANEIKKEVDEKMKVHQQVPRPESERSSQRSDYKGPATPQDYNKYRQGAEEKVNGQHALQRETARQPYDDKIAQIKTSAPSQPSPDVPASSQSKFTVIPPTPGAPAPSQSKFTAVPPTPGSQPVAEAAKPQQGELSQSFNTAATPPAPAPSQSKFTAVPPAPGSQPVAEATKPRQGDLSQSFNTAAAPGTRPTNQSSPSPTTTPPMPPTPDKQPVAEAAKPQQGGLSQSFNTAAVPGTPPTNQSSPSPATTPPIPPTPDKQPVAEAKPQQGGLSESFNTAAAPDPNR